MNDSVLIKNCTLYNSSPGDQIDILVENSRISKIAKDVQDVSNIPVLDAGKKIAAPGFIDVHIQGAGGFDILDCSEEAIRTMSQTLARLGTTGFLGTTVVKPTEKNAHLKLSHEFVNKNLSGATLLGFHIEGPFINMKRKGGLDPKSIYAYSPGALDEILDDTGGALRMMTIAPELEGHLDAIRMLVQNKVVASFGHSDATYEQTKKGFDAGINHVTHIFNAMPPLHHREPGPLSAIFENKNVSAQIISDGHHLHPSIINMIYKLLGAERCVCITDGVQGMGLHEGRYVYNGKKYESRNGAARYMDGTLIGSTMSLGNIALKFKEFTGRSLREAIDTITINPAKLLKIDDRKGSIDKGKDADIVLFDDDYSIYATLVSGKVVYKK